MMQSLDAQQACKFFQNLHNQSQGGNACNETSGPQNSSEQKQVMVLPSWPQTNHKDWPLPCGSVRYKAIDKNLVSQRGWASEQQQQAPWETLIYWLLLLLCLVSCQKQQKCRGDRRSRTQRARRCWHETQNGSKALNWWQAAGACRLEKGRMLLEPWRKVNDVERG